MKPQIYVKPAKGRRVHAEFSARLIWESGERVVQTPYINRRISQGDLVVVDEANAKAMPLPVSPDEPRTGFQSGCPQGEAAQVGGRSSVKKSNKKGD